MTEVYLNENRHLVNVIVNVINRRFTTGRGGFNTKDVLGAWYYKSQIRKKRPIFSVLGVIKVNSASFLKCYGIEACLVL